MTKLKDVIHFYLGCEVEYEGILNGSELKAEKEANKDDFFYVPKVQEVKGVKRGILRSIEVRQDGSLSRIKVGRRGLKSFWFEPNVKPILRPLSDLNEDDFYSFFGDGTGRDILIKAKIDRYWCAGWYDKKEYDERVVEELPIDAPSLLYDLDEADYNNVYTCDKAGNLAYGLNDEMRYFLPVPEIAAWINHLRERQIDCDNLIETNQAIKKQ
jgi:hypothetical protein